MKKRTFWQSFPYTLLHIIIPAFSLFFILGDVDPPGSLFNKPDILLAAKIMWLPLLMLMSIAMESNKSYWQVLGFLPTLLFVIFDTLVLGAHWFSSLMMFGVLHYASMVLAVTGAFVAMPRHYTKKRARLFFEVFTSYSLAAIPGVVTLVLIARHLWIYEYTPMVFFILVALVILESAVFLKDFDKMTQLDKV